MEKVQQLSQNYLNRKSTIIAVVCVISKHFSTQVFRVVVATKMYGRKKNARERLDLSQLQNTTTVSTMVTLEDLENNQQQEENVIDQEILNSSTSDIINRTKLLDNDIKVMRSESQRLNHEKTVMLERIKDNQEKINNNKQLPYLVGNVVELLNLDADKEASEQGANIDIDAARAGKSAVIKTSTRQTIFLPMIGLVDPSKLKPNDLIGVNKDSYLVLDTLPSEYDSRVKAMEVDENQLKTILILVDWTNKLRN